MVKWLDLKENEQPNSLKKLKHSKSSVQQRFGKAVTFEVKVQEYF